MEPEAMPWQSAGTPVPAARDRGRKIRAIPTPMTTDGPRMLTR